MTIPLLHLLGHYITRGFVKMKPVISKIHFLYQLILAINSIVAKPPPQNKQKLPCVIFSSV